VGAGERLWLGKRKRHLKRAEAPRGGGGTGARRASTPRFEVGRGYESTQRAHLLVRYLQRRRAAAGASPYSGAGRSGAVEAKQAGTDTT